MKLSGDHKATVIENDPLACAEIRQINQRVKSGEISIEKAARLRENTAGYAIQRWVERCKKDGMPLRLAARELIK